MILPADRPLIMGIVNVTPDSFSGDGLCNGESATEQAAKMVYDGAAIIDIGGESSRPGAASVSVEEEMRRVIPAVKSIRAQCAAALIAVDTTKADVAEAALAAGANIINDISAMAQDARMVEIVAEAKCPVVLMHNRATSNIAHAKIGGVYQAAAYGDVVEDVKRDLMQRVEVARHGGIADDNIILDPGFGFGKSVEDNLALLRRLPEIKALGFPVLVGTSRKSFIGHILDAPINDRLEGTAATVAISAFLGADIIRVHDVKFMARVARMAAATKTSVFI